MSGRAKVGTRMAWLVALAAVAAPAAGCKRRPPSGPPTLAVVYTADVAGGAEGLARRATLVDRARVEARGVVQVDAGDLFAAGSDADPARRARLMVSAYRRMGVDAITVGERELALGPAALQALVTESKVPMVAANLLRAGRPLFPPELLTHAGGIAVGIFGVVELPAEATAPWRAFDVSVSDPVVAARSAIASLRKRGARFVIGLFHVAGGAARAREIVGDGGGVDLVVLGHGGPGDALDAEGRPRVVHAGAGGANIGRADARDVGSRDPLRVDDRLLALDAAVPAQLGVGLLLRLDKGPVAKTLVELVGPNNFETWKYGSNAACALCHKTQFAQWKTTDHAAAFATLRDKGHGTEPDCLGCHMTGFLQPGGSQNLEVTTEQFADVGCESCHGPSVAHVASINKKVGTSRKVPATVCLGCHTPDWNIGAFDYVAGLKEVLGPGHGQP